MPWLILFGLGAYLLWKERAKLTNSTAPATVTLPSSVDTMTAPPPDAPQDPPQDGGAPAPEGGGSGGGGYADPGPTGTAPAPTPVSLPVIAPPKMTLVDAAKTPSVLSFATRPTVEPVGIRGTRVPHDPAPAPTGPSPLSSAVIPQAAPKYAEAPGAKTTGGKTLL